MSITVFVVGVAVGIALVIGVAFGSDAYSSWRHHFQRVRELRERPKVPMNLREIKLSRSDQPYRDDYWVATAFDEGGAKLCWDSDTHPMDAVLVALERAKEDSK